MFACVIIFIMYWFLVLIHNFVMFSFSFITFVMFSCLLLLCFVCVRFARLLSVQTKRNLFYMDSTTTGIFKGGWGVGGQIRKILDHTQKNIKAHMSLFVCVESEDQMIDDSIDSFPRLLHKAFQLPH